MKKYLFLLLLGVACISSCKKDNKDDPKPTTSTTFVPPFTPFYLTQTTLSTSSADLEITNFTQTGITLETNGSKQYYSIDYTFEIHNKTSNAIVWGTDNTLQTYIVSNSVSYGASGMQYASTIPANGSITVTYSSNTGQLADATNIDGTQLKITLYNNANSANPMVTITSAIKASN